MDFPLILGLDKGRDVTEELLVKNTLGVFFTSIIKQLSNRTVLDL